MKKKVINLAFILILSSIILSYVFTFITGGFHKYKASIFGLQLSTVVSESMVPVLKVGDIQICKTIDFDDVEVGDIVLYWHIDKIIIHRVIQKVDTEQEKYLVMKGDNNKDPDKWNVYPEDIISKTIINIPVSKM